MFNLFIVVLAELKITHDAIFNRVVIKTILTINKWVTHA